MDMSSGKNKNSFDTKKRLRSSTKIELETGQISVFYVGIVEKAYGDLRNRIGSGERSGGLRASV